MNTVTEQDIREIRTPGVTSHKGQNGKLLLIGGSELFHAAGLWALTVASRIVDLVHFSSVPENNDIVRNAKDEFRNGIVVPRADLDSYIEEDDCVLIGPGMTRDDETKTLTDTLLSKYPEKQWVIDAGALQLMDLSLIPHNAILTPHRGEFASLLKRANHTESGTEPASDEEKVCRFARTHRCIVLLKGPTDIVSDGSDTRCIEGGNAGMTKGGTGDVLAGLIAALACKNAPMTATIAGSFLNKKAGDSLYKTMGPYFNSSDLALQIPAVMKDVFIGT